MKTATEDSRRPSVERGTSGSKPLKGKRVAILATDGFEQAELTEPRSALDRLGAATHVIAPRSGKIRGWQSRKSGDEVKVDVALGEANADDYDALMLPGGVLNADALRTDKAAVAFVRDRHLTSWPSLKTDLLNAGAIWSDEELVVDRGLVTSRRPADIPASQSQNGPR